MDLSGFEDYCRINGIAPEETGAAFAAWLALNSDWDGRAEQVGEGSEGDRRANSPVRADRHCRCRRGGHGWFAASGPR